MNLYKDLLFMVAGAAIVLLYQRYNEPMMRCVDNMIHKTANKAKKEFSDMM